MKSRLKFLHMNKICKAKKKITTAILILAMAVTSITVSDSCARAEVQSYSGPTKDYDAFINFYCSSFNVRDTSGNILFEKVNGVVTQQDMQRVKYTYTSRNESEVPIIGCYSKQKDSLYSNNNLTIKGCKYFIITCTIENSSNAAYVTAYNFFYISIPSKTAQYFNNVTPNMEISVFDGEIESEIPTTKLQWKKVKNAERYVIDREPIYIDIDCVKGEEKIAVTKKPNYTVRNVKGTSYKIRAQKKVKGRWKTIKTIDITL